MNSKNHRSIARNVLILSFMAAIFFSTLSFSQEINTESAQALLNTLGYNAGSEDGYFGPETESALKLFQKEHEIPITGLLDEKTIELLTYRLKNLTVDTKGTEVALPEIKENVDQEEVETTLDSNKPVVDTGLNSTDWIIVIVSLLILFLIFWLIYRILRWVKNTISTFYSKIFRPTKINNQANYDLKAQQITEIDHPPSSSKNKQVTASLFKKTNQNSAQVSKTHDSNNSYTSLTGNAAQTIKDNRSTPQKETNTVNKIFSIKKKSAWIPPGQKVKVKGFTIDGFVYVATAPRNSHTNEPDNAFIDPALSVGKVNNDWDDQDLSYWPNYYRLSAPSRATYLNWLSEGRTRVVDPGYMFLFFYGLERRYFRDTPSAADREKIIIEVVRLRNLFSDNRSASNYLSVFLDAASLTEDFDSPPEVRVGAGLPLSLKVGLGRRAVRGEVIRSDWLLAWYLASPEAKLRTPARRCQAEFEAMFKALFDKDYPNGMKIKPPKRKLTATYDAASGQFSTDLTSYIGNLPDVGSLRKPISYAEKIADFATNALNGLSRLVGKNENARATLLGHTLLPAEIQPLFPCEEMVALRDWIQNVLARGGLVNSLELLEQLTTERPDKLSRKSLTNASDTLQKLGVGLAPDPRFALRSPKMGEPVILFELPEDTRALEVSENFRLTSLKLGAATMMAQSDNEFSESELIVINSIVENTGGLDASEKARLTATAKWMQTVPPDMTTLRRKIKQSPKGTREAIASLAIDVAVADGDASNEEIKQLETLYKALDLDSSKIHSALHTSFSSKSDEPVTMRPAKVASEGPPIPDERIQKTSGIGLDLAKIDRIDKNTREVSVLLSDIFSDQTEDDNDEEITPHPNASTLPGLSPKLTALAKELATQDHWSEADFDTLVTRHGAMPAGAVEAINEWSFNTYDTAYLDEYNGYDIEPDIAAKIGD